jgi:quercetin dioxygenase-like cupin family protein
VDGVFDESRVLRAMSGHILDSASLPVCSRAVRASEKAPLNKMLFSLRKKAQAPRCLLRTPLSSGPLPKGQIMQSNKRYFIRASEVSGYSPANHTGTVNKRLISPETVGSRNIEVVLGVIEKGQGALPHAHPGIEQVCYMLAGSARAEVAGNSYDMLPGDCCYFPADEEHIFTVTSDEPARLIVVYSPPYEERPERVIKRSEGMRD